MSKVSAVSGPLQQKLRTFLQSEASRAEKAIVLIFCMARPSSVADLKQLAAANGLRVPASWNVSSSLARTGGDAILTPNGWELTEAGTRRAEALGFGSRTPAVAQTYQSLRAEIAHIERAETRAFLSEAAECLEAGHFRAAIIMSWVAAVHLLHQLAIREGLAALNAEMLRRDSKWRPAKTEDDLSRIKESDFLDVLEKIGLLSKDKKTDLKQCLSRRNSCGHPNSFVVKELSAAHHVETLVVNVFSKK